MKLCATCKQTLDSSEFLKNNKAKDGLQSSCRGCISKYMKERRKRPDVKAYNVTCCATWRAKNKVKVKAYNAVYWAVSKGKLKRLPCEVCGLEKSEAHHDDYEKPLDVRWLCKKHHTEHHKKLNEAVTAAAIAAIKE